MVDGTQGFSEFSNSNWILKGTEDLRGFKDVELEGLIKTDQAKSIYKLVLKVKGATGTKADFESEGIKGALGLIKATWKGSTKNWEVESIEINGTNKVWLLMAQGDKAIYLMPVVRVSNKCGSGEGNWWKDRNKELKTIVETRGISDIKFWTSEFDLGKEWLKEKDEEFKKQIESGFSITRNVETAVWSWTEGGADYGAIDSLETINQRESGGNVLTKENTRFLGKNAGILSFTDSTTSTQKCNEIEHYFLLDLVILGKTSEESGTKIQPSIDSSKKEQTIKITDEIKEVIGVKINYLSGENDFFNSVPLLFRKGKDNLS